MRCHVLRVFDQYVSSVGTPALGRRTENNPVEQSIVDALHGEGLYGATTDSKSAEALGAYDEFGLMVAVDDVSSTSAVNFDLFVDHSGDGLNWLPYTQTNQTPPFHTGIGDVRLSVSQFSPGVGWCAFSARGVSGVGVSGVSGPFLHYVRLYMVIAAGTAHVRVHAFHRDVRSSLKKKVKEGD